MRATITWRGPGARLRAGLAVVVALALGGWQPFRTPDPDVEAGNRAYAEGRYDDALAAYDRAHRRGEVDGDGLAFDRGTAELRKAEAAKDPAEKRRLTERALDDLKQATRSKDPRIRSAASYNRGNALMAQDKLDEAIEAYKQALRDNSELDDARLNLELALRRRQKHPNPPPPPTTGQGQQGQDQGQGQGQGQSDPSGKGDGSNQHSGSDGDGSNQPPQAGSGGQGSNQQNDASGQGADPRGGSPDQSASGSGSNAQGSNGSADPRRGQQPKGRPRPTPRSPRTPTDGKLDFLDGVSGQLQKDQARRRATGKASDPQHDW